MVSIQLAIVKLGVLYSILGNASAFLATPLNASDPDLVHILCPDQTEGITRDHKWITREAIRKNIRKFFLNYPPPDTPGFTIPESASLTEIFHAYYGDQASPARFIRAVNAIAEANVHADSADSLKYDPTIQADAEIFGDFQTRMSDRYTQIVTAINTDGSFPAARTLLGTSLHSLQKFYAHSTWVEQGNDDPVDGLGLPRFEGFGNVTEPNEAACKPCPSSQGECKDNVILSAGLTTGYYYYVQKEAEGFLVPKPTTGGEKCSHGGVLDDSAETPAIGGINKDTASPCFSPHHYLHEKAAQLAVNATDEYLNVILEAVTENNYRQLFDLYHGSAVSIVIDTTGSMGPEISAVKSQIHQIVESSGAALYVLVPFNDPKVGPVTKTEDPKKILEAVDALKAHDGGDAPEMFWSGLQLAVTNTPEYSAIFCFTDAVGKDGELMNGDIALAQQMNIKVSMIFSQDDRMIGDDITTMDDYHTLCDLTGGLFIPSEKFNVSAVTPLIDDSVQSRKVDILTMKEITGAKNITIPIDDSIVDVMVQLVGEPSLSLLVDAAGQTYNLLDKAAMSNISNVKVISYTDTIRALRWLKPSYGIWELHVMSNDELSVSVQANSTLSWEGGFALLDPSPPHPHYMSVEGNPLAGTVYYIDVILVGYIESHVTDVDHIDYVTINGDILRTIDYSGDVDDEFYVRSNPLPSDAFYMMLYGRVDSGNVFCRLMPVLIRAVQTGVEVASTSKELSAKPGESAQAKFIVSNYGLESDFSITGNDDKHYMTFITPSVHIQTNSSALVYANFTVPSTAIPGTVSTVTVTAASIKQTSSFNSAITQFVVLPPDVDHDSPLCKIHTDEKPDCDGFKIVGYCFDKNWTAEATLQDYGSGMSMIYPKPNVSSSKVDYFSSGSKSPINITIISSCCTLQVDIVGVDVVGNVGKCSIDMGDLEGTIINFKIVEVGLTWTNLEWSVSDDSPTVSQYRLDDNDELSWTVNCSDKTCLYNATELKECSLQSFTLTPIFNVNSKKVEGKASFASSHTTGDTTPVDYVNVSSVTPTSVNVSWGPDVGCEDYYEVCYYCDDSSCPIETCENTNKTNLFYMDLLSCVSYHFSVSSVSFSNQLSNKTWANFTMPEPVPGAPRNVRVTEATAHTLTVNYCDPNDSPQCMTEIHQNISKVNEYDSLVYKDATGQVVENLDNCTNHIFEDLDGCTEYKISMRTSSASGKFSDWVTTYGTTKADMCTEPKDLSVLSKAQTTITFHWIAPEANSRCVVKYTLTWDGGKFYFVPEENKSYFPQDMEGEVQGLTACTEYIFTLTPLLSDGEEGPSAQIRSKTEC